jgi:hypothetical protein
VGCYTTTSPYTRCCPVKILDALSISKRRASVSYAEGRRISTCSSSINPTFQIALLLGGYSTSASLCHHLSLMSPRPTKSMLPSHLFLTSLWSAFRPSLKVCRSYQILVRSVVLQAMAVPCIHFKPQDLLSRSFMFAFIRAWEFFYPRAPYATIRRHVFTLHRCEFVSAASTKRRSGA